MQNRVIVFDIDGTLADLTHRRHHVAEKPKNWPAFFDGMPDDVPHPEIVDLVRLLFDNGNTIVLCSGRNECYRAVTIDWMKRHDVPFHSLFMRANGDYRQDNIVKVELLQLIRYQFGEPFLWFDDRQQVVDSIRAEGVKVLQVAEGNF